MNPAHEFRNGSEFPPKAKKPEPKKPNLRAMPELKCVCAKDFLGMDIQPREMLLNPVLPAQGLAMLHGPRGRGKTHIALGIAAAVSSGSTFLRWKAIEPHRVLFIDGELPAGVLQPWVAEAIATIGGNAAGENLRLITPDLQEFGIPDLATYQGQSILAEHTEWADLIILDNLSSLVRSGKENEAESWLPIQAWALDLRRHGKSVLFVHHSGRNGQPRGTSKREDLLDTIIALRVPHTYNSKDGLRTEICFDKHRHFYGTHAEPFEVSMMTGEDGVPVWTISDIEIAGFDKAAKLFDEGCDVLAVKEELGISRATAFRYRKQWQGSQKSQGGETG